jgi:hypothetical protein
MYEFLHSQAIMSSLHIYIIQVLINTLCRLFHILIVKASQLLQIVLKSWAKFQPNLFLLLLIISFLFTFLPFTEWNSYWAKL